MKIFNSRHANVVDTTARINYVADKAVLLVNGFSVTLSDVEIDRIIEARNQFHREHKHRGY